MSDQKLFTFPPWAQTFWKGHRVSANQITELYAVGQSACAIVTLRPCICTGEGKQIAE